jgi:MFS family permease
VPIARLAIALFALQAGFHGYTASLPLALTRAGVPDPEIGVIMGIAALVQVPAALVGGRLVDRFGGVRLLFLGGVAYLAGTAVFLLPWVEPGGPTSWFILARVLQGVGIAGTLPAALSLVPRMVSRERHGVGLSFVGAAHNLTLVVLPTISIAALDAGSLHAVALVVAAFTLGGMGLLWRLPIRAAGEPSGAPAASRRFGITFRRSWAVPLGVITLYVAHWGLVATYLPARAEAAGADIGLFFAADGIAILLMRIPTGWLADRISTRVLVLVGAGATAAGMVLLLLPPTTPVLVLVGFIAGAGGAVVLTPVLVDLSRRSTDADRGSAFALFSAGLAVAIALGSIGAAPLIGTAGFEAGLTIGIAMIGAAMVLVLADPGTPARGASTTPPATGVA